MRFDKYGRTVQLSIRSAEDLRAVLSLDESHWVSTSAPITAFRGNAGFLGMLDADADGRINSDELRAAVGWMLDRLADPRVVPTADQALPLTALAPGTAARKALLDSARYVLQATSAAADGVITLQQIQTFVAGIESRPLNGDGIVPPDAAANPAVAAFIQLVIDAGWGVPDTGGRIGIGESQLQGFLGGLPAYLEWRRRGMLLSPDTTSEIKPFGESTVERHALLREQAERVDTFFRLCHVLQFDARSASRVGGADSAIDALDPTHGEGIDGYLEKLPIARPHIEAELPLDHAHVNPLCHHWLTAFRDRLVEPILQTVPERLRESDWLRIKRTFAPYEAYLSQRPKTFTDAVPLARLEAALDSPHHEDVRKLMAEDVEVAAVLRDAREVERLLLYTTYLLDFANNFVSFPYLYAAEARAMFEVGSAVIDGRWFAFAVRVPDAASHAAVAKTGHLFIMYLDVTCASQPAFTVAVPVTSGSKGNLTVGKRGVFFDTARREYDARIVNILENPISVREALAAPFVKLWNLAQGKIEAWSSAAEKGLEKEFSKTLEAGGQALPPAPAAPEHTPTRSANLFLGLGVTAAALGSAFAFITKTFAGMTPVHVLYSLGAAAAIVILPVSLVAMLKLRQQDLSVLLEGCGWAINARMKLNRQQRRQFTRFAPYPAGAAGVPRRRILRTVLLVILAAVAAAAMVQTRRRLEKPRNPAYTLDPADVPQRNPAP